MICPPILIAEIIELGVALAVGVAEMLS